MPRPATCFTPKCIQVRENYHKNKDKRRASMREDYHANVEQRQASYKDWYENGGREHILGKRKENPEPTRKRKRIQTLRQYGLTVEEYWKMYAKQEGRCAICKRHSSEFKKNLHVDHDHETGEVRGLLCHNCNSAIGLLMDDVGVVQEAADYLRQYKTREGEKTDDANADETTDGA